MNPDILENMRLSTQLQRAIRERIPLIGNLWQGVRMVNDIPMEDEILAVKRDENAANHRTNDHIQPSESPSAIRAVSAGDEWCETFLSGADFSGVGGETSGAWRLERIVSFGNVSPPGFWYDQTEHEWVVLLTGSAVLRFDTPNTPREEVLHHSKTSPSDAFSRQNLNRGSSNDVPRSENVSSQKCVPGEKSEKTGASKETDVSEKTEENEGWSCTLRPGDWLWIPAHVRHRVDSTAANVPTLWLAFFCK